MNIDDSTNACSSEYWRKYREYLGNDSRRLGVVADQEKYEASVREGRGLLISSSMLVSNSLELIACGFTEAGLGKAAMAKQYAQAALDIGDLVYPNRPIESGRHVAHRNLAAAKWILGESGWESRCRESVSWWREYLGAPHKYDSFLRTEHIWEAVIPLLIVGDFARADAEYRLAFSNLQPDPAKIAQNSRQLGKTFGIVVGYLAGNSNLADIARETLSKFRNNASQWGCEQGQKTEPLWKGITVPRHVLLARVWASFFCGENDPIRVILSIR